jgi:hypothetical protein
MIEEMDNKTVMKGRVDVYVPQGDSMGIKLGSGIVGQPAQSGMIEIYYEGNLIGAGNLENYAERCYCAAGRMKARYPTVAHRLVSPEAVKLIGSLDLRTGKIDLEVEPVEVAAWVDLSDVREMRAPSVMHHLEHRLGTEIMRHPGNHAHLLAQLGSVDEETRQYLIERAALSLGDD